MDVILALIGKYYGLDWATLVLGVSSSYLFSNRKLRHGFGLGIVACICSMAVAVMSAQTGFIVYNALLIAINIRGLTRGDRRESEEKKIVLETADVATTQPSVVPVRVHAR